MKTLTLFSKENCPPCKAMKLILTRNHIPFNELPAFNKDGTVTKEFEPFVNNHFIRTVPLLARDENNFTTLPNLESIRKLLT